MITIQPYTHEDLLRNLPNLDNSLLLDLGCGSQREFSMAYLSYLYKQKAEKPEVPIEKNNRPESRIVAVDLEHKLLGVLQSGMSVSADATNLPFKDAIFDIVAAGCLFNRFKLDSELENALAESVRVLKLGGYLIGDIPLSPSFPEHWESVTIAQINPDYSEQIMKYKKMMTEKGLEFLKEGIGYNSNQIVLAMKFYFYAVKNN